MIPLSANKLFFNILTFLGIVLTFVTIIYWFEINDNEVSLPKFIGSIISYTLITGFGFFYSFYNFRRTRLVEDIPTSKIRSAHQGFVELEGTAKPLPESKLISPLTKRDCLWYEYSIYRGNFQNGLIDSGSSPDIPFLLQDETGICLIDPKDAEVTSSHTKTWVASKNDPSNPDETRGTYHYIESVLLENDDLYAIGYFETINESMRSKYQSQFSRKILKKWKNNQDRLKEKFDGNQDGQIDLSEWKIAEETAEQIASQKFSETLNNYPHRLGYPNNKVRGQQYLISNTPQNDLPQYYRERAKISLYFFFHCCLLTGIIISKYSFSPS